MSKMSTEEVKLILLGLSQMNLLMGNILSILFKDDVIPVAREILKQNIVDLNKTLEKLEGLGENTDGDH